MPQSLGRNTRLENIWRTLTRFFSRSANIATGQTAPLVGQVGAFSSESMWSRRWDQEYLEIPVRDGQRARELIELRKRPEIAAALDILTSDVFSSEDGDDLGFGISKTIDDEGTPIDPRILEILVNLIDRVMRGDVLNTVVEEYLVYGDSFRSLVIDPNHTKILKLKQLPTWEMFRIEDEDSNVLRFEQRRYLSGADDSAIYRIHPVVMVHWRYRRLYKYGRSLFEEIVEDSYKLEEAYFAVDKAAMAIGINPNIHLMPAGWTKEQCEAYKQAYENERDQNGRLLTDFFMGQGGDVKKLAGTWNPDLTALIDNVMQRRMRIAMRSRVPPWMIGLPTQGAREIAGQPALAYARFIGSIRAVLVEGLRQIMDLELALNGYTKEQMIYRLTFPKIYTDPQMKSVADLNEDDTDGQQGIEDLDRQRLLLSSNDRNRYSTHDLGN
jgi:hypothetical protein